MIEPTAWVDEIWITRPDLVMSQKLDIGKLFMRSAEGVKNYIPLYVHPSRERELEVQIESLRAEHDRLINDYQLVLEKLRRKT